jgi:hypothetical protein
VQGLQEGRTSKINEAVDENKGSGNPPKRVWVRY